ncbi:class I SAM-dependent methyltransferase [Nocardioides sp. KIGAM211]|uniref:Class I SAM-dependent methyltransferase n=1 Tax=Nocardioides luti TaxID=2761101 RepID=A0A7X0RDN5_9ACTN|nr:class I SAM-dependent methyltransferase [Nocardioides luti]
MQHAYDTVAADYAARLPDTRAETPLDLAMVDAFAEAVVGAAGGDGLVLDAGCGTGRMSRHLAGRGLRTVGLDLSHGMVTMARRAQPGTSYVVGALGALPYADASFAGVLLWYSTIHTPPDEQSALLSEAARVLRPGGHLLVGFQAGTGVRDVAPAYRALGHEVVLERHLASPDEMGTRLADAGLVEVARLVRRAVGSERDDQAALLARRPD